MPHHFIFFNKHESFQLNITRMHLSIIRFHQISKVNEFEIIEIK